MKIIQKLKLTKEYVKLLRASLRDVRRYGKHACIGWNRSHYDDGQLEGRMIANYHVIEKGLSMPDFRPCFGIPVVKTLIRLTKEGNERFGWECNVNYQTAIKVIHAYMKRHQDLGIDLSKYFSKEEIEIGKACDTGEDVVAGSITHRCKTYFEDASAPFPEFAKSRHSCRNFDQEKEVDLAKIREAINAARYTPSVCNRQCWRVHLYTDRKMVSELLTLQNGNRGFGHTIPVLLVITSSLSVFDGYQERNQAYVDGGLFSMSLMYGLHNQELGCVPLCWLAGAKDDDKVREIGVIPERETVVMMMGVGVPVDEFQAPASQRRSTEEILTQH